MTKCEVHETNVSGYYGNDNGWVVEKDGWVFVPTGDSDDYGESRRCLPTRTYQEYTGQIKASQIHYCFTSVNGNSYATINGIRMVFTTTTARYQRIKTGPGIRDYWPGTPSYEESGIKPYEVDNIYYSPVKKGDFVKGGMKVFGSASYRTQPVIWCPNRT